MTKSDMQKISPSFRRVYSASRDGMVAIPKFQPLLYDPEFEGVNIEVPAFEKFRAPDGWFHPSTHPTWTDWELFTYLTAPDALVPDIFDYEGTLAVTAGTFFHDFIQHLGLTHGILDRYPNCPCGKDHNEAEIMLVDEESKSRGHSDGSMGDDGFELKTMNPMKAQQFNKVPFGPERTRLFREKCWDYWCQAQEYLRMSGRRRMVVMIVVTSYPFELTEIHIPYDPVDAMRIREKYLRVLDDIEHKQFPSIYGCCGGKKDCLAAALCPGGRS